MLEPNPRRHVYVVGRESQLDVAAAVRRSAEERADLVVLCVGRTLSQLQRNVITEALRFSSEIGVDMDAEWVPSEPGLRSALATSRDVTVLTGKADGDEIERIVAEHLRAASASRSSFRATGRADPAGGT